MFMRCFLEIKFADIRLISLEHVTYIYRRMQQVIKTNQISFNLPNNSSLHNPLIYGACMRVYVRVCMRVYVRVCASNVREETIPVEKDTFLLYFKDIC